jgi:D-threo-aldose 1-dehydrogenase
MTQNEALCRFAREGDFDCFLLAGRYTLLDVSALAELLPLCLAKNIAVIVGGVFNSGVLANPWLPATTFDYRPAVTFRVEQARHLATITERHGVPLAAAALQFALGHPAVVAVLMGPRSVSEAVEDIQLFELDIPASVWSELQNSGYMPGGVPMPNGVH